MSRKFLQDKFDELIAADPQRKLMVRLRNDANFMQCLNGPVTAHSMSTMDGDGDVIHGKIYECRSEGMRAHQTHPGEQPVPVPIVIPFFFSFEDVMSFSTGAVDVEQPLIKTRPDGPGGGRLISL